MKWLLFPLLALSLSSCAIVDSKGILLDVEVNTPVEAHDLQKHCDLGDAAACALAYPEKDSAFPKASLPIVQGIAPPDRAVFAAVIPKGQKYSWFLFDRALNYLWKLPTIRIYSRPTSPWQVQRVEIRGLLPNRAYDLLASDEQGKLVESRTFHTLSTNERSLRVIAATGLSNASSMAAANILTSAMNQKATLIVFAGGNFNLRVPKVLHPKPTAIFDHFYSLYAKQRANDSFAFSHALTPVAAIWNDSEYGQPRGNQSFFYRDQAREALEVFFPQWPDENYIVDGPGVSKSISLGDERLLLLDNRSFRLPFLQVADAGAHLGRIQTEWIQRQKEAANGPVSLISGEPWVGAAEGDWLNQSARANPILGNGPHGGIAILEPVGGKLTLRNFLPAE